MADNRVKVLQPTKQQKFNRKIYGFDVETYNNNKSFLCGSIYGDDGTLYFTSKQNMIKALQSTHFQNSLMVATNLTFDFFQLFFKNKLLLKFRTLFRGSDMINAKTFIYNGGFHLKNKQKTGERKLEFTDTMNFSRLSVDAWGKILKVPKLKKPSFLGKYPKNSKQWAYIKKYNIRDSLISQKAMKFLINTFDMLGASYRMTLASTSMSLFTNKYLKNKYFRHPEKIIAEIFKCYYGGRTEAFCRGKFKDKDYKDVNSLYPAEMEKNVFPDPNSLRISYVNSLHYISKYEGCSHVDLECPYMEYPLLPYRFKSKLFFPYGTFSGWYTHVELREALKLGYKIKRVLKTIYYTKTCRPFKDFVNDLYKKRRDYIEMDSPIEHIVKITMNSLYGKFGQKYKDKDNYTPFNHSFKELSDFKSYEILHDGLMIRVVQDTEPARFCIPIWCSYVTAYGRITLHKAIVKNKALYCDTDSIITNVKSPSSDLLGEWQLEHKLKKGLIVKPKMYYFIDDKDKPKLKAKGVGVKLTLTSFLDLITRKKIYYDKFMKPKEAMRRKGFVAGEIVPMKKEFDLEDTKRQWDKPFNTNEFQRSKPVKFINGVVDSNLHKDLFKKLKLKELEI